jgi:3-methyladenine DNA glycosylase Mpg
MPKKVQRFETTITGRIGIKNGADKPWRFYIKSNEFVSKK